MIDIDLLRKDPSTVTANLARRGVDAGAIKKVLALDEEWRALTLQIEQSQAAKNQANAAIAAASQEKRASLIASLQAKTAEAKTNAQRLDELTTERAVAWQALPNLVFDDVPDGGAEQFEVIRESAVKPTDGGRDYFSLTEPTYIDLERAAKVSGSRFVYLKSYVARLELALVSYIFDQLTPRGFTPVLPPVLIKRDAMAGMGYLEQAEDEVYQTQDDLYLVGTSEQALGPLHMNETLLSETLPLRYVAYSSCFRREAGSHGKDVRGILRLHQFNKVEMFSFTTPEHSQTEHEFLLEQQTAIMDALQLPYRVIKLAARDLGAPSAKTYDIETWIPSENKYRETHSTSNTTDYQSRRLNIRVKGSDNASTKAHLLNGTALAMSRALIALLENHQQADGSIAIPTALHSYLPFTSIPAQPT